MITKWTMKKTRKGWEVYYCGDFYDVFGSRREAQKEIDRHADVIIDQVDDREWGRLAMMEERNE